MSVALSASLTAHQRATARQPFLGVTATLKRAQSDLLRWVRLYTGAEADARIAAVVAPDGSLIRARISGSSIVVSRVATPGPGSTFSAWTTLTSTSISSATPIALAAKAGELILAYGDTTRTVRYFTSVNNGVSWSGTTALITEASNIGTIAAGYNAAGNRRLCWTRTGSPGSLFSALFTTVWGGFGSWSNSSAVTNVTAIAMVYDGAALDCVQEQLRALNGSTPPTGPP